MLDVLGLDPRIRPGPRGPMTGSDRVSTPGRGAAAAAAGGPRPQGLRRRRRRPRPAGRSASRSRTPPTVPAGPWRWRSDECRATASARARSASAARATRPGSGGRVRRGLEGKGPTPKAEDRPHHKAYRDKRAADQQPPAQRPPAAHRTPGAGPEWVAGRNAVLEALEAESRSRPRTWPRVPTATTGCARSSTCRRAGHRAARGDQGRARPATDGAVHQGVARSCRPTSTPIPTTCWPRALDADRPSADRGSRLGHRPAQPRRGGPLGRGFRRPRRGGPRAPGRRHDRRRVEDLGRRRGPDPGRPGHQPRPDAARVRRRRAHLVGLDGAADTDIAVATERPARWCWSSAARATACRGWCASPATPLVAIPIAADVESLNAGVAAGIALYEISRQRT